MNDFIFVGGFDDDNDDEEEELRPPPEKLSNLLLQCAIQAQLSYYNEFKNEMRSRWLESFLGHEHLRVERTGAKGGGKILYRGLSNGLRCSWLDYFRTMLKGKPEKYEVRYKIGTPDIAGTAMGQKNSSAYNAAAAGAGNAGGEQPAWAAASASRAANPYLQKGEAVQYREFTETIDPRLIANGLMSICRQLCNEWEYDLTKFVAREGEYLLHECQDAAEECEIIDGVGGVLTALGGNISALQDPLVQLPGIIYSTLRAASADWNSDFNEEGTTPFRAENFDLLQRALTREAALSVLAELEASSSDNTGDAASALFLRERIEVYAPLWESCPRNQLGLLFLLELNTAAPTPRTVEGGLGLTDPAMVADRVLGARWDLAREWGKSIGENTPPMLQRLLLESLETEEEG